MNEGMNEYMNEGMEINKYKRLSEWLNERISNKYR